MGNCSCQFCKYRNEFNLPDNFIEDLVKGNIVLFAGAGISTENKNVFPRTFYEEISMELESTKKFPDLMEEFCSRPNGRIRLIQKIKKRFQYAKSFPSIYGLATQFHCELASIPYFSIIITTNWDSYFEDECAATPFVIPADFHLWNIEGRKVLKIHGSINNIGSMVITRDDYDKVEEKLNKDLVGAFLKTIVGTKSILFIGYSLKDEDFMQIYSFLKNSLGNLMPTSYVVTIDNESEKYFKSIGMIPIFTDATYFIEIIKEHLIVNNFMMDDKKFLKVAELLDFINPLHLSISKEISLSDYPEFMYTLSFQDGVIHALERILEMYKTGEVSMKEVIQQQIEAYKKLRIKSDYFDKAYIDGYVEGLKIFAIEEIETKDFQFYYLYGLKRDEQPKNKDDFIKLLEKRICTRNSENSDAIISATHVIQELQNSDPEITIHHTPFLYTYE